MILPWTMDILLMYSLMDRAFHESYRWNILIFSFYQADDLCHLGKCLLLHYFYYKGFPLQIFSYRTIIFQNLNISDILNFLFCTGFDLTSFNGFHLFNKSTDSFFSSMGNLMVWSKILTGHLDWFNIVLCPAFKLNSFCHLIWTFFAPIGHP